MHQRYADAAPALILLTVCVGAGGAAMVGQTGALSWHLVAFTSAAAALMVRCDVDDRTWRARRRRMYERVLDLCVRLERVCPRLTPVWMVVWRWAWDRAGV